MLLLVQAFDQQQQDLVDAASKALSYRQDIIEENIRLTYALQVTPPPLLSSFFDVLALPRIYMQSINSPYLLSLYP
jgi:hypothetical protein